MTDEERMSKIIEQAKSDGVSNGVLHILSRWLDNRPDEKDLERARNTIMDPDIQDFLRNYGEN